MSNPVAVGQPGRGRPVRRLSPRSPALTSPLAKEVSVSFWVLALQEARQCYCAVAVFAVQLLQSRARANAHGGGFGRGGWRRGFLLAWETGLLPLGAKRRLPWKPSNSSVSLCRGCGCQLQHFLVERPPLGGRRLLLPTRSQGECVSSAALNRPSGQLAGSCSGARVVGARHSASSQASILQ